MLDQRDIQISVIITTFNYARYLGRAIRSVFNQSTGREYYEILVVDDASTDETVSVLNDYTDLIKPIVLENNVGLAQARNIGVHSAIGRFVVFVDADDYIHNDMLRIQQAFLSHNPAMNAVSVDYFIVDDKEQHVKRVSAESEPIACGIMFRKDLLFDVGLYDPKFMAHEDQDLRIRFLKKHNIYNIKLPLYRYRRHDSNMTSDTKTMEKYSRMLADKHRGEVDCG